jgi:hypothetical protein
MFRGAWIWLFAALCAWSAAACANKAPEPELGGDTHWLQACDQDRECARGSCTCGVCTESCERNAECAGERAAQCYATAAPGVQAACAAGSAPDSEAKGICLAQCKLDRECGSGQWCVDGACVRARETEQPATTDTSAPAGQLPSTRASDFAGLASNVSFDEPAVALAEPEREFAGGGAEQLLGTWLEPGCDPADGETWHYLAGCVTLSIARVGPNGAIQGQISVRDEVETLPSQVNWREFAPARDPDVGYPVEIEPKDYREVGRFGPSSLLDPFFDGTRLHFWTSSMELWDGWCKLQTSYRVPGGDPPYQCVSEGAATGSVAVDHGKLVLCTTEWSAGSCEVLGCTGGGGSCETPISIGCNCTDVGNVNGLERPECSPAYCRCDERGCGANWPAGRIDTEATWDGVAITVRAGWGMQRGGAAMGTLVRETGP